MSEKISEEKMDPQDYFNLIKDKKHTTNDKFFDDFQVVVEKEMSKAMATNQTFLLRRLAYAHAVISKERDLLAQGINVYVLKEDIEDYIKNVADKVVKIIELEKYPRTIPDEVAEKIQALKENNSFDQYYVVFTDYTGEAERQVAKERRRKDPIIFGAFEQKLEGIWDILDRFYYIADWEDEYCDLTLAKMVDAMTKKKKKSIVKESSIKQATIEEVRAYVNALQEQENNRFTLKPKKSSFFDKIKTCYKLLTE